MFNFCRSVSLSSQIFIIPHKASLCQTSFTAVWQSYTTFSTKARKLPAPGKQLRNYWQPMMSWQDESFPPLLDAFPEQQLLLAAGLQIIWFYPAAGADWIIGLTLKSLHGLKLRLHLNFILLLLHKKNTTVNLSTNDRCLVTRQHKEIFEIQKPVN